MSDGVEPSKGAMRAAKLIARSDKLRPLVNGYMLRETAAADFCAIIDRETKSPQMAALLNAELDSLDDWLRDESISDEIKGEMLLREDEIQKLLKQIGAERLLSELEVKP